MSCFARAYVASPTPRTIIQVPLKYNYCVYQPLEWKPQNRFGQVRAISPLYYRVIKARLCHNYAKVKRITSAQCYTDCRCAVINTSKTILIIRGMLKILHVTVLWHHQVYCETYIYTTILAFFACVLYMFTLCAWTQYIYKIVLFWRDALSEK